ncbi:MAG TPA: diacylglycerol kinase family protein [Puia sp.]|nr:diacylglycerol kinase family protein [Puia sp.]
MQTQKFSLRRRLKSFHYAFAGIGKMLRTEHNASIHLFAAIISLIAAIFFKMTARELSLLVFAIALVWITEMINTCIEKIMDFISLVDHPQIQFIKDVAAGAVLIAAFAAVLIGLLIFTPKILCLWK